MVPISTVGCGEGSTAASRGVTKFHSGICPTPTQRASHVGREGRCSSRSPFRTDFLQPDRQTPFCSPGPARPLIDNVTKSNSMFVPLSLAGCVPWDLSVSATFLKVSSINHPSEFCLLNDRNTGGWLLKVLGNIQSQEHEAPQRNKLDFYFYS